MGVLQGKNRSTPRLTPGWPLDVSENLCKNTNWSKSSGTERGTLSCSLFLSGSVQRMDPHDGWAQLYAGWPSWHDPHIYWEQDSEYTNLCVCLLLNQGCFVCTRLQSVNPNTMTQDLTTNYELISSCLCVATAQATHLSSLHSAAPRLSQLHPPHPAPETCGPYSGINQSHVCAAQPASC